MLKNDGEVRESYYLWYGTISLDFGKLQFSHWAISHLFMELMIQPAMPRARAGMVFAPLAPLVQGREQAAQASVLHSWSAEWETFFLLHMGGPEAGLGCPRVAEVPSCCGQWCPLSFIPSQSCVNEVCWQEQQVIDTSPFLTSAKRDAWSTSCPW